MYVDFHSYVIIGTVNWALPATFGNGSLIFDWIIKFGATYDVSQQLLICTGIARAFLLGISMNCGFVGGIIFPFLTMGLISGSLMYIRYPSCPLGLCIGTFMVSIACGIVPMPFTFTGLSCFVFFFGLYQTVPIFVATIVSYAVVCGSGLFKKLARGAQKKPEGDGGSVAEESKESEASGSVSKQEADEFALKQYLGNKKHLPASSSSANSSVSNTPK